MKKIMKMAFAVVAFAAVGLGSYKAYGSYTAANISEEDLLIAENVEALADEPETVPDHKMNLTATTCITYTWDGNGYKRVHGHITACDQSEFNTTCSKGCCVAK